MQTTQRLDDNEHTYVGRDFPPPTPAHLSARLVPTQLQPLLLLSVSPGKQRSQTRCLPEAKVESAAYRCVCTGVLLLLQTGGGLTEAISRQQSDSCSVQTCATPC